jgi:uncharacterized protein YjbI with pentapeptide repeats
MPKTGTLEAIRMPFCSNCGKELPSAAAFCPSCGSSVSVVAAPPPVGAPGAASMASDQFRAIVEICNKSQELLDERSRKVGPRTALSESQSHKSMWDEYAKRFPQPVELRQANFSGLLFAHVWFKRHTFTGCDFSRTRWIFASIRDSNCTGSSFAGITTILDPFINADCTSCDFTGANISFFNPFQTNNFENADFTNAKITTSHSFFGQSKLDSRDRFDNAIMNGCVFSIRREKQPQYNKSTGELRSILEKIFSPD